VSISHVVGQSISLGLGGLLLHLTGSMRDTVAVLVLGPLAMIFVVAVWFPETHGRELEDIVDGLPAASAWLSPVDRPVAADLAIAADHGSAPEPEE
jgi:hypothetical protein